LICILRTIGATKDIEAKKKKKERKKKTIPRDAHAEFSRSFGTFHRCADVCVCAPKIYGSHMLQFNINDKEKKRKIMYMERFQPATFYLIHYIYIISTRRLYNTCGLFIYFFIVCNKGNNEKGKQ